MGGGDHERGRMKKRVGEPTRNKLSSAMRSLALRAARLARPRLMLARAASTGSSADFPGRAVKVSHVLLPPNTPPSTLDALEARAASGEPFADLAREASKCPSAGAGGSLGWLAPNGDFSLNVAIRTLLLNQDGTGQYHVGGGIVNDSVAELEWNECHWKARIVIDRPATT